METPLRVLTTAGFPLADAVLGWQTVYSYVIGFVIEEQAVHPRPGGDRPALRPRPPRRPDRPVSFPLTRAGGPEGFAGPAERSARDWT
jgi:hypothetical protein